jgi:hypothetical protein
MKNQIHIKSLAKGTLVTIRSGHKKPKSTRFGSIEEAINFVLPLGNRHTELDLNGYPTALAGWVP